MADLSGSLPVFGDDVGVRARVRVLIRSQPSLKPNANPAGKAFQKAMFEQGIPITAFEASDIEAQFRRLKALGVAFTQEPTRSGPVTVAVFSDTCGKLIQLYQQR